MSSETLTIRTPNINDTKEADKENSTHFDINGGERSPDNLL